MKPYLMEAVGTFFLTIAITLNGNPLSIGLMLAAIIYIGGHISGGHYNPAVSLAVWMRKKLNGSQLMFYMLSQTIGAITAIYIAKAVLGWTFSLNIQTFSTPFFVAFGMEILLTCLLCWIILTVTTIHTLKNTPIYGVAIGLTLTAIASIGGPIGSLFNPAVGAGSLITDLLQNSHTLSTESITQFAHSTTIYLGGPLLGGAFAAVAFDYFNSSQQPQ